MLAKNVLRILILLSSFIGCAIKFGVFRGEFRLYQFLYFTTLSNIIVLFNYICVLRNKYIIKSDYQKGVMRVSIFATFLIYHFLLTKNGFGDSAVFSGQWLGSVLLHYVTPFLVAADWILFDRRSNFKWYYPFAWLLYPAFYFVVIVFAANIGNFFPNQATPYPYYFIDVVSLGWGAVLKNIATVAVFFAFLGYIIYGINYFFVNKN